MIRLSYRIILIRLENKDSTRGKGALGSFSEKGFVANSDPKAAYEAPNCCDITSAQIHFPLLHAT